MKNSLDSNISHWIINLQKELNKNFNCSIPIDASNYSRTLAACPVLGFGLRGKIIEIIQARLNDLNFNCGLPDGVFGKNTKNSILSLQKSEGLIPNGIIGFSTWEKLLTL